MTLTYQVFSLLDQKNNTNISNNWNWIKRENLDIFRSSYAFVSKAETCVFFWLMLIIGRWVISARFHTRWLLFLLLPRKIPPLPSLLPSLPLSLSPSLSLTLSLFIAPTHLVISFKAFISSLRYCTWAFFMLTPQRSLSLAWTFQNLFRKMNETCK